jgi:hypothetical protein
MVITTKTLITNLREVKLDFYLRERKPSYLVVIKLIIFIMCTLQISGFEILWRIFGGHLHKVQEKLHIT